jgi:DNA-binding GntR family transcriptional regulator
VDELIQSITEHEEITDAILKGDPDRAEISIQGNWAHGVKRLSRVIEDLGERGSW